VSLVQLCDALEASPKPVVAAINGMALGGGCELALACHYRIIVMGDYITNKKIQMGLPETQIGLIPGAGGTQRLPRLVGMEQALQMIVTGQSVGPQQALHMGLVDAIVTTMEEVQRWAEWAELFLPRTRQTCLQSPPKTQHGRKTETELQVLEAAVQTRNMRLPTAPRGGDAVQAAIQALKAAATMNFDKGMTEEGRLFTHLLAHSAQGRARRLVFFAERAIHKTRRGTNNTNHTNNNKKKDAL
jgi:3-hydroxyacyl-CoA dehydrogenase